MLTVYNYMMFIRGLNGLPILCNKTKERKPLLEVGKKAMGFLPKISFEIKMLSVLVCYSQKLLLGQKIMTKQFMNCSKTFMWNMDIQKKFVSLQLNKVNQDQKLLEQ